MSLLDLLSSLSDAPGAGFGAAPAVAADAAAAGGSSPPMCFSPPQMSEPEMSLPPSLPGSWDRLFESDPAVPEGQESDGSSESAQHEPGSERFMFPPSGTRDYVVLGGLQRYGSWIRTGSSAARAAKSLTGLVVVPVAAVLACAEDSIRSPIIGGGPTPAPPR